MKTLCIATASAVLIGSCIGLPIFTARAETSENACADDARQAIASARQALQNDSSDEYRTALSCLVEAVAILDARLSGLSDGSMPFEGQIHAPRGVVMTKPSVQGDR
jgi:hypothetical protein